MRKRVEVDRADLGADVVCLDPIGGLEQSPKAPIFIDQVVEQAELGPRSCELVFERLNPLLRLAALMQQASKMLDACCRQIDGK